MQKGIITVKEGGTGAYRTRPRLEWPEGEEALTWDERSSQQRYMMKFKCGNQNKLKMDLNSGSDTMWIDPVTGQVFNVNHTLVGKCTHRNPDRTYRANSFQAYAHPPSEP